MIIRPVTAEDYPALRKIAAMTGTGFTSLQDDDAQVQRKLDWALQSFAQPEAQAENLFLFALEDSETGDIAGFCGIESAVGLSDPWYNYRVGIRVHASRELGVYNKMTTLTISNDHTGYSELCTLFLLPEYRKDGNGQLLSKSRFLFLAEFPEHFSDHVLAEMRGICDDNGISPFWEGLGRHFFAIDFQDADQASAHNKAFIAELMPKYPLYAELLPPDAQATIGITHETTIPARKLLEQEGLRYTGYIDIFDGGPTLEAHRDDIRAIHDSQYVKLQINDDVEIDTKAERWLISNTEFNDFRCLMTPISRGGGHSIEVPAKIAKQINVEAGSTVRIVRLSPQSHR